MLLLWGLFYQHSDVKWPRITMSCELSEKTTLWKGENCSHTLLLVVSLMTISYCYNIWRRFSYWCFYPKRMGALSFLRLSTFTQNFKHVWPNKTKIFPENNNFSALMGRGCSLYAYGVKFYSFYPKFFSAILAAIERDFTSILASIQAGSKKPVGYIPFTFWQRVNDQSNSYRSFHNNELLVCDITRSAPE